VLLPSPGTSTVRSDEAFCHPVFPACLLVTSFINPIIFDAVVKLRDFAFGDDGRWVEISCALSERTRIFGVTPGLRKASTPG
jgi:hypothetical protein